MKTIKELAYDYIEIIAQSSVLSVGEPIYYFNSKRTEIHDQLLKVLDCDPATLQNISGSLDLWIAFPHDEKLLSDENMITSLSLRFYKLVTSEFFKTASWTELEHCRKKLNELFFNSIDFSGWYEGIKL